jgi:phytoene dehydrogenase-like protein
MAISFMALTPDQLFPARPMHGFAAYRMPIAGLYLCGAGAHPGGGVTGAPGHNAAQAVIADLFGNNIGIGYSNHSTHRNCSDIAQISG